MPAIDKTTAATAAAALHCARLGLSSWKAEVSHQKDKRPLRGRVVPLGLSPAHNLCLLPANCAACRAEQSTQTVQPLSEIQ